MPAALVKVVIMNFSRKVLQLPASAPHEVGRAHEQGEWPVGVEGGVEPLPPKVVVGFWQSEPREVVELSQLDPKSTGSC